MTFTLKHALAAASLATLLTACGGGDDPADVFKTINIERANMECPVGNDGGSNDNTSGAVRVGQDFQVKATAIVTGINFSDIAWSWDADAGVNVKSNSQKDNSSTANFTAPSKPGQYRVNVHARNGSKSGDQYCTVRVVS
ncbi:MAG: hypothetical protein QM803_20550 [Rhodocyclaceae bacterium]